MSGSTIARILAPWPLIVAAIVLGALPSASAHEEDTLDPHNATPGVRLELKEEASTDASSDVRYRLHGTGFASDMRFSLWEQRFGREFRLMASGLRLNESGHVVRADPTEGAGPNRERPLLVGPGRYPHGAVWMVALVSADHRVRTFAAVIPRPMVASDGPCRLELELISYLGDRFVATGAGFPPGEVTIEVAAGSRVVRNRRRISSDGRLTPDVVSHEVTDAERALRYAVQDTSCRVAIEYRSGKAALEPREGR